MHEKYVIHNISYILHYLYSNFIYILYFNIYFLSDAIKNTCPTITDAQFEENLKLWFRQANLQLHRENERNRNNNARNNV